MHVAKYKQYKQRLLSTVMLFAVLIVSCSNSVTQIEAARSTIQQDYGISIQTLEAVTQLPRSVVARINNGETTVQLTQLNNGQYLSYIEIVKKALQKYPSDLIRKQLKTIYIGGPYQENDAIITGMYGQGVLYLFYNHSGGDNNPLFLEQTFHHEFSSILIHQYNFDAFGWLKLNPEDFSYIINPEKIDDYMNSIQSYEADDALLAQGLVSRYGKTNAENDINTYAELIFTQPEKMKNFITKYPVIAQKYQMLKRFYLSISPQFKPVFAMIK